MVMTTIKNCPIANNSSNVPIDDKMIAANVVINNAETGVPPLLTAAAFQKQSVASRANMMRGAIINMALMIPMSESSATIVTS